jgi:hypothetical protein
MSKYHDDSAMGWASHCRNDLPHIRFRSAGIEAINSLSNIYTEGASHLSKGATTHSNDKSKQRQAEGPVPSFGNYGP